MTFVEIAVAVDGIVHSPFVPDTASVTVSPGPIGVVLVPTVEDERVSTNRHGTVGTYDDTVVVPAKTLWATLTVVTAAAESNAAAPTCTNL